MCGIIIHIISPTLTGEIYIEVTVALYYLNVTEKQKACVIKHNHPDDKNKLHT